MSEEGSIEIVTGLTDGLRKYPSIAGGASFGDPNKRVLFCNPKKQIGEPCQLLYADGPSISSYVMPYAVPLNGVVHESDIGVQNTWSNAFQNVAFDNSIRQCDWYFPYIHTTGGYTQEQVQSSGNSYFEFRSYIRGRYSGARMDRYDGSVAIIPNEISMRQWMNAVYNDITTVFNSDKANYTAFPANDIEGEYIGLKQGGNGLSTSMRAWYYQRLLMNEWARASSSGETYQHSMYVAHESSFTTTPHFFYFPCIDDYVYMDIEVTVGSNVTNPKAAIVPPSKMTLMQYDSIANAGFNRIEDFSESGTNGTLFVKGRSLGVEITVDQIYDLTGNETRTFKFSNVRVKMPDNTFDDGSGNTWTRRNRLLCFIPRFTLGLPSMYEINNEAVYKEGVGNTSHALLTGADKEDVESPVFDLGFTFDFKYTLKLTKDVFASGRL